MVARPGTTFLYGPSHWEVLGAVLKGRLEPRHLTLMGYLNDRLLRPLGLQVESLQDGDGNPLMYAGMSMGARDWLKLGVSLLDTWKRRSPRPLIPRDLLEVAWRPSQACSAYGLSFWVNWHAGAPEAVEADVEAWIGEGPARAEDWSRACLSRDAPKDLVACIGSAGQRLYIVPSQDLVIARFGKRSTFKDGEFLGLLFKPKPFKEP